MRLGILYFWPGRMLSHKHPCKHDSSKIEASIFVNEITEAHNFVKLCRFSDISMELIAIFR